MHPGAVARDEAIDAAERAADELWKSIAIRAVRWIAGMQDEFTTDAVWAAIETYYPKAHTREPRAMGAVIRRAASLDWIERTDRTQLSTRAQSHRRPIRIWRSVL